MNTSDVRRTGRVERYDTIVIGAGQAGLAMGYHLSKHDADFLIVDGAARVGDSWRRRWDSLRLFTPAAYSSLPGMPFPAARAHFPDKDEVADYLERYAQRFDLPVRLNTHVASLHWNGHRYVLDTGAIQYEARHIVIATGSCRAPRIPALSQELSTGIHQLHSSRYRTPFELPPGPVLVVGAGNSGAQIALEVSRFRTVYLAGRIKGSIPRTLFGRDIYRWLWPIAVRLTVDTKLGRWLRRRMSHDPVVGISEARLASAGIERGTRVTSVRDGRPVVDGARLDVSTVTWCTGFTPELSWIRMPFVLDGDMPRTVHGAAVGVPGLYFVGLRFEHTMTSALLGGVGADAARIATQIRRAEIY